MAKKEAFITLKDHKVNFANALPCRLINPAKPEMGKILKAILDRIISAVQQQLPLKGTPPRFADKNHFSGKMTF